MASVNDTTLPAIDRSGRDRGETDAVRSETPEQRHFRDLYSDHYSRIYWYLRTRVTTDEEAADLTQQVFLNAWEALPRYQERGLPIAAWLFRIARNAAVNAGRAQRKVLPWVLLPTSARAIASDEPEQVAVRREALSRLRYILRDLRTDQRDCWLSALPPDLRYGRSRRLSGCARTP